MFIPIGISSFFFLSFNWVFFVCNLLFLLFIRNNVCTKVDVISVTDIFMSLEENFPSLVNKSSEFLCNLRIFKRVVSVSCCEKIRYNETENYPLKYLWSKLRTKLLRLIYGTSFIASSAASIV